LVQLAYSQVARTAWIGWKDSYACVTFFDGNEAFGFLQTDKKGIRCTLSGEIVYFADIDKIELVHESGATVTIFDRNN
jgi:hypothetical protein